MSQSLWDISEALERLVLEHTDSDTGELDEKFEADLDDLHLAKEQKILAIARYALGEKAEGEMVKAQADRLAKRAQIHRNKHDRLKAYLAAAIEYGDTFADEVVQVRTQRNPPSVVIPPDACFASWPDEFVRVSYAADKRALIDAEHDGEMLPPGVQIQQLWGVRIK